MVTPVAGVNGDDVSENCPPDEVVAKLTASPPVPALTGLPNWSCSCTVRVLDGTPAVSIWDVPAVYTSLDAAAAFIVNVVVTDVSVPDDAVIVGLPGDVSW